MHSSTRYNIGSNEPLLSQTFACPEPLSRRQQLLVTGASLPPSIVTPSPGYEKRHPRWEQTLDTHLGPRENSLDGAVGVVQTFQSSTTASPLVVAVVDRARHRYSTVLVTNRNLNSERSEIPSTWRRENEQPRRTKPNATTTSHTRGLISFSGVETRAGRVPGTPAHLVGRTCCLHVHEWQNDPARASTGREL